MEILQNEVTQPQLTEPVSKKTKEKKTKDEILEILIVILLGITALLTAWASWIGALHGGNQANNYTQSNNIAADGNSRWNQAAQLLSEDMTLWNEISGLQIDLSFAQEKGNTAEVERLEWRLDHLYADNVSEELEAAIVWAGEQDEYASPFEMEGFTESYFVDARAVLDEAETVLKAGQEDNTNGDTFGLVTVVYSMVLFLLGIASPFKSIKNKFVMVAISAVGMIATTIFMLTLPLPTGFSLASFFS
ncbi:MAG: hypothetical protein RR232_00040 [Clostridia bacterium]